MGEGGVKNPEKLQTSFMNGPYVNVFTQIVMFSLSKVDHLRAREREEKGITNFALNRNLKEKLRNIFS